jgi:hypothetical protein
LMRAGDPSLFRCHRHLCDGVLSEWMAKHARVCWTVTPEPWLPESQLIRELLLPLNLDQNGNGHFRADLSAARARQRVMARELPILAR